MAICYSLLLHKLVFLVQKFSKIDRTRLAFEGDISPPSNTRINARWGHRAFYYDNYQGVVLSPPSEIVPPTDS
jgi:hypothetical protein